MGGDIAVIDWKKILVAYIDHVGDCEGTDFLPGSFPTLAPEEQAALYELAAEERLPECQEELRRAAAEAITGKE